MRISVKLASLALAASLLLTGCGVSITGVTLGLPATMERGSTGQATPEYAYSGATLEYGALPFSLAAQTHTWWYIDSTDSAYWALLNNMNAIALLLGWPLCPLTPIYQLSRTNERQI